MNCFNHAEVQAAAFCIRCGHALCPECTRNVRGSIYCEPCLAEIVSGSSASSAPGGASPGPNPAGETAKKKELVYGSNPGAAFALGLIPGVGAIYNGDFPRNYNRLAGRSSMGANSFKLAANGEDLSGPWHCRFGSHHPGVCQFAFGDGHVATLNVSVDVDILHKLAVRNDGKPVEDL